MSEYRKDIKLLVEGELSDAEKDIIFRYLGRQGLKVKEVLVEESETGSAESKAA